MSSNMAEFYKGIKMLAFGSLSARLIGLASIPILTRLYSPEEFGALSVFSSLILIAAPMLTLRYVTAIPLPKSDKLAVGVVVISLMLVLLLSTVLFMLLYCLHDYLFLMLNVSDYISYWLVIPLGCFLVAFYEIINMWAVRKKDYKSLMSVTAFQSFAGEGVKISLGFLGLTKLGLIVGFVVSQSAGLFYLLRKSFPIIIEGLKGFRLNRLVFLFKYYIGYPIFRMPSQVLLLLASQSPLLFFSYQYGVEAAGQFGLALMAIVLPMNLIGQAVSKAYYAEIASIGKSNMKHMMMLTIGLQRKLLLLGIPIVLCLYVFAEPLFPLLFGSTWTGAGLYVSILSLYLLTQFTSAPLMQVFNVFNMQDKYLIINVLRVVVLVFAYYGALILEVSEVDFIRSYSVLMFMFYLVVTLYVLLFLNQRKRVCD